MNGDRARSVAFSRDVMLEAQVPPLAETGVIRWLRENLFSNWLNVTLTALSLAFIYYILSHILPWLLNSIWSAGSLTECREIRNATIGPNASSACFSVITDRWDQLIFRFLAPDLYWRPILALVLFLVAIAPSLFDTLPRWMLGITVAAPFALFFLIFGGSIWGPISVALGFALGFACIKLASMLGTRIFGAISASALVILLWWKITPYLIMFLSDWILYWLPETSYITGLLLFMSRVVGVALPAFLGLFWYRLAPILDVNILGLIVAVTSTILYLSYFAAILAGFIDSFLPIGIEVVKTTDIGGFTLSFIIGTTGIILSLPLGILLALGRQSDLLFFNKVSVAFIEIIRGIPLIVWLFTASLLLNYFLPKGVEFDLLLRVIIMVTLFSAAYIAEVIRGGLAALPTGQYEAANALGLDYWKSMRLIILPQALKISIPGIVNTFIGLFKDTTLVVFISLNDPIALINSIRADTDWNGVYWELYVFVALLFFVCCFSMSRYSLYLEKKLEREHR